MGLKVLVLSVAVQPPLYVECSGRKIALGRSAEAGVRLPDPTVSPNHATLRKRGQNYLVVDEDSTNGTALLSQGAEEPVWLSSGSPRVIEDGDRLILGQVELQVLVTSEAEGLPSEDLAIDLVAASLATLGHEVSPELVDEALSELTEADDEPLQLPRAEAPPPPQVHPEDDVVLGHRSRTLLDLVVLLFASVLLAGSGLAIYWLLSRAG